ncbi:MAG: glycosyltransferase [Bacteroidales bacterium]|nr:glycosyltransferase [Bacteroidales bacterium]
MKILIVISNMFGGGAQRVISRLANSLSEDNDVMILAFSTASTFPLAENIRIFNLEEPEIHFADKIGIVRLMLLRAKRVLALSKQLRDLKRKETPDVTISFLEYPNVMNALTGGKDRRIMSERNNPRRKGRMYTYMEQFSFHFADAVVFQTNVVKEMFSSVIRRKGVVIPNPVQVDCLATGGSKKIVTMGRLHPQKNHELLIRSFARFSRTHPSHTLHIYGKDYGECRLQSLIDGLSLTGKVFLEGFVNDVHNAIADAEQFVMSSDYEGTPNALLEAMMMGLPCISTDFEGIREMLGDSGACVLTPVGDECSLAEAMSSLADDPALRNQLSMRGMKFGDSYSLEKVLPLWKEVIGLK